MSQSIHTILDKLSKYIVEVQSRLLDDSFSLRADRKEELEWWKIRRKLLLYFSHEEKRNANPFAEEIDYNLGLSTEHFPQSQLYIVRLRRLLNELVIPLQPSVASEIQKVVTDKAEPAPPSEARTYKAWQNRNREAIEYHELLLYFESDLKKIVYTVEAALGESIQKLPEQNVNNNETVTFPNKKFDKVPKDETNKSVEKDKPKERKSHESTIQRDEDIRQTVDNFMKLEGKKRTDAIRLTCERFKLSESTIERALRLKQRY